MADPTASRVTLRALLGSGPGAPSDDAIDAALRDCAGDVDTAAAVLLSAAEASTSSAAAATTGGTAGVLRAGTTEGGGGGAGGGGGSSSGATTATTGDGGAAVGEEEDDEALARRLQAELDAAEGGGGGGGGGVGGGVGVGGSGSTAESDEAMARRLQAEMDDPWGGMGGGGSHTGGMGMGGGGGGDMLGALFGGMGGGMGGGGDEDPQAVLKELLDQVKTTLLPELAGKLGEVELPDLDEKATESVAVQVSKLSVSGVEVPAETTAMEMDVAGGGLRLQVAGVKAALEDFEWAYQKSTFPKLKDSGKGRVEVADTAIDARVSVTPSPTAGLVLRVTGCDVAVNSLTIKLRGSIASGLYNAVIAALKPQIKAALEKALADMVTSTVEQAGSDLMASLS